MKEGFRSFKPSTNAHKAKIVIPAPGETEGLPESLELCAIDLTDSPPRITPSGLLRCTECAARD